MKNKPGVVKKGPDGKYHCLRSHKDGTPCGHVWEARKTDGPPVRCPKCFSPIWFVPEKAKTEYNCPNSLCGHKWASRGSKPPLRCPKCKWLLKPKLPSLKPPTPKPATV